MDLKVVPHKTFKRIFFNFLVICTLVVGTGFLLYRYRIPVFPAFLSAFSLKNVFLYAGVSAVLVLLFHLINHRKKQAIQRLTSVEEKIPVYEKFYSRRLWWHVVSCGASAFFLLLTYHYIFFYFGLFDLLSLLSNYPSRDMLKKEMDEEDLLFN